MSEHSILNTAPAVIFIVDDDNGSRQLLNDILSSSNYLIHTFSNGREALMAAQEQPPNLILLDVMMPEMDGFEVCKLLKENPLTRFVPVVMVTTLNEKTMKLKGIAVGADEFISKPVDSTEILLRTRNMLLVQQYQEFLKQHAVILEQQVRQRTEELEKAVDDLKATQQQMVQQEKLAAIGQLTAGIAHEINNPVGFISSNVSTLNKYCEKLTQYIDFLLKQFQISQSDPDLARRLQETRSQMKIERVLKDIPEMIGETLDGVERIKSIVNDLKCFSRLDDSHHVLADINQCLESSLNIVHNELKYKATLKKELGDLPQLLCYPQQLSQVFVNLLVNAAHAIEEQGEIVVRSWCAGDNILVVISDTGCGITDMVRSHIFEPFFTTKELGKGTGLGLSISADIINRHGGEISLVSEVGVGTTFTICLPLISPVNASGDGVVMKA